MSDDFAPGSSFDAKTVNENNKLIIEEFRANGGKLGGFFAGHNALLLHTRGAKSNQPRVNPLGYLMDGDNFVIVASKGGEPTNPDWYYNIKAHPEVSIEVGTETINAYATIPEREERDRIFAQAVQEEPGFGVYQQNTSRVIPVVVLKRI